MTTIYKWLALHPVKEDIGIEIEAEFTCPLPMLEIPFWGITEDHSLRGYSAEFVTKTPIKIENVDKTLNVLKQTLKSCGVQVLDSFRAGVHIHVNCQDLTLNQVGNFAAVYYCLERMLTKFCGPTREGNFFCLRLKDAEAPLFHLILALQKNNPHPLNTDNLRYSALNFRSLFKHGSLEFRAMATRPDFSRISEWAKILYALKEYAVTLEKRPRIAEDISFLGPEMWARQVLGDQYFALLKYENCEKDIMSSMRNVQELIYLKNGE